MDDWADILFCPCDGGGYRTVQRDAGAGRTGECKQYLHARVRDLRARDARSSATYELRERFKRRKRHICQLEHRRRRHPTAKLSPSKKYAHIYLYSTGASLKIP